MTSLQDEVHANVGGFADMSPAQNTAQVTSAVQVPVPPSVHRSHANDKKSNSLTSLQWNQMKADLNAEISAARKQLTLHEHCLNLQHKAENSQGNMSQLESEKTQKATTGNYRKPQNEHNLVNLQIGKVKLQLQPPALGKKQVLFLKYKEPPPGEGVLDKPDSESEPLITSPEVSPSQRDKAFATDSEKQKGSDRSTEKSFKICLTNVRDESATSSDVYFDIAKCIRNEKYPGRKSPDDSEDSPDDSDDDDEVSEKKEEEKFPKMTVSWREMTKMYFCKICVFQSFSIRLACQHLLVEHVDVVEPLGDFLSNKTVSDCDSNQSLYEYILENLPPISRKNTMGGWNLEDDDCVDSLPSQSMQAGQNIESLDSEFGICSEKERNCCENEGELHHPYYQEKDSDSLSKDSQDQFLGDSPRKTSENKEMKRGSCSGEQVLSRKVTNRESTLLETQELLSLLRKWMKVHYKCPHCHVKMYYMKMTSYHHCDRTRRTVLCQGCGKYFSSGVYFQHFRRVHSTSKKTATCKFCQKEMASYLLSNHVRRHHSGPREIYQCGICGRQLGSQQHLSKHEMIHRTEKPYKCSVCQRGFTQRTNMKKHMRQHTGERPYKCDKCEKCFTHNVSLKNHLKRYHGIDLWKEGHTGVGRPKKNKID